MKQYTKQEADDILTLLNKGAEAARKNKEIRRLKELLAIKRDAEAILDDDTVNSWFTNGEIRYTKEEVNKAAEDYNNAVKETDLIIENL